MIKFASDFASSCVSVVCNFVSEMPQHAVQKLDYSLNHDNKLRIVFSSGVGNDLDQTDA